MDSCEGKGEDGMQQVGIDRNQTTASVVREWRSLEDAEGKTKALMQESGAGCRHRSPRGPGAQAQQQKARSPDAS